MSKSSSGRLLNDNGSASPAVAAFPPLPDEPYWPDMPPWPPQTWPQARWTAWWQALVRWCVYRTERRQATVLPLAPPPPLEAPLAQWQGWWSEWMRWKSELQPDAAVVWPEFPAGWQVCLLPPETICILCARLTPPEEIRKCPHCGSSVCRECLFLSLDACPVDGFCEK